MVREVVQSLFLEVFKRSVEVAPVDLVQWCLEGLGSQLDLISGV